MYVLSLNLNSHHFGVNTSGASVTIRLLFELFGIHGVEVLAACGDGLPEHLPAYDYAFLLFGGTDP